MADAKTAKNRAKRQKKKERSKTKGEEKDDDDEGVPSPSTAAEGNAMTAPLKKRRLVNGKELVFRRPGEDSDEEEAEEAGSRAERTGEEVTGEAKQPAEVQAVVEAPRIVIYDD
jgi:hypothetical protein